MKLLSILLSLANDGEALTIIIAIILITGIIVLCIKNLKIGGIALVVFGSLGFINALSININPSGGIIFIVLGLFFISRAKKKKEEDEKKKKWEEGNKNE